MIGLYWNLLHLFEKLSKESRRLPKIRFRFVSISVDTWGVDYAYLDQNGDLLYQPHCYRDNQMGRYEESFYNAISKKELFQKQVQPATINTVLQIYSDLQEKPNLRNIVQRVLFIPDLINYFTFRCSSLMNTQLQVQVGYWISLHKTSLKKYLNA